MSDGVIRYETEVSVAFSTGSTIKYKYEKDETGVVITRDVVLAGGGGVVPVTIDGLRADSNVLKKVADFFSTLPGILE